MKETITLSKLNESYLRVDCDISILHELKDHFTFDVPGAKYTPKYKMGVWDGKISLMNIVKRTIPGGMFHLVKEFADARDYDVTVSQSNYGLPTDYHNLLPEDLASYVKSLDLRSKGEVLQVRDYQYFAIYKSLKDMRKTLISSTGSGKSLLIYCIVRYLLENDMKVLLVVPTTSLVLQMFNDFADYSSANGWSTEDNVHKIMAGENKRSSKPVFISTWQSLSAKGKDGGLPSEYFQQFDAVIVDETHQAGAKELQGILDKCTEAKWRIGTTGSLNDNKINHLQIQGMLGPILKVSSTKELQQKGHLAEINIKCVTFDYRKDTKAAVMKSKDYHTEVHFIVTHQTRNKFIVNLANDLEGNTLVLYNFVEKHGDELDKLFKEKIHEDRKYFYLHGGVDAEERDEIRPIVESSKNAIILASFGVFSTGVNIKRIHNIILASPTKSIVRVLQSIGRGLRMGDGKDCLNLFDLSDNLSNSSNKKNITYDHFIERLKIYAEQQFDYTTTTVPIE